MVIKSKKEFADWLTKPATVYKKGSKGKESWEFNQLSDFLVLESHSRKEGINMNNSVKNQIYKIMNGMMKHFYSYYYGFEITIKYKK